MRASKAEGEVEELTNKARQLETELDLTKENLGIATLKLDEKEKQLSATELEMNALNRYAMIAQFYYSAYPSRIKMCLQTCFESRGGPGEDRGEDAGCGH